MRNLFTALCFAAALFFIFSITITTRTAIPDRALFLVDEDKKLAVPAPLPNNYIFYDIPNRSDDFWDGSITWKELRNDPEYSDFHLPQTPQWDEFKFFGPEVSLLRSWIYPPPDRWTAEGYWRY